MFGAIGVLFALAVHSVSFTPDGWSSSVEHYRQNSTGILEVVQGKAALVIRKADNGESDTAWTFTGDSFPVTGGSEFVVALRFGGDLPERLYSPGAKICWLKPDGSPLVAVDALGKSFARADCLELPLKRQSSFWSRTFTRGLVPPGAGRGRIVIGEDHPNVGPGESFCISGIRYVERRKGEAWDYDDLEAPELKVLTQSPCPDLTAPIRFRLEDKSGVDYAHMACHVDGVDVTKSLVREGDVFSFRPEKDWAPESVHGLEVRAKDLKGFESTEWGFVAFTREKVRHPVVSIRDDGVVLRDGRPFFPVGVYNVHACEPNGNDLDAAVRELKENGVNLPLTYMVRGKGDEMSRRYDELEDACTRHGLPLLPEPAIRKGEKRDGMLFDNLMHGRSVPCTFGWTLGDDTSGHQLPRDLKRSYRLAKAVDPQALAFSVDIIHDACQQAPFVPFADVLVLELYPIRTETPQDGEMAQIADCMDAGWAAVAISGCAARSVFAAPQAFCGWNNWKRYPTKEEVRAMAFISLACRARGLAFYTYHSYGKNCGVMSTPGRKSDFFEVTREISALSESLAGRDAARQPEVRISNGPAANVLGGASVRCLLKEDGLLIAANTSAAAVVATIRLPSGISITHRFPRFGVLVRRI